MQGRESEGEMEESTGARSRMGSYSILRRRLYFKAEGGIEGV